MIVFKDIKWFLHHGVLLPMATPDTEVNLDREDQKYLLKKTNARFIRWTNQFDKENAEFWYIIKDSFKGFEELSSNTRNQVRRGLKNFSAKPTDFDRLRREGYKTYLSAFQRFVTFEKPMSEANFERHLWNLENSKYYEAWGIWDNRFVRRFRYRNDFSIHQLPCRLTEQKRNIHYLP